MAMKSKGSLHVWSPENFLIFHRRGPTFTPPALKREAIIKRGIIQPRICQNPSGFEKDLLSLVAVQITSLWERATGIGMLLQAERGKAGGTEPTLAHFISFLFGLFKT